MHDERTDKLQRALTHSLAHTAARKHTHTTDEPVTVLSVKLHDGTRQRAKFNQHRHTVTDLHGFIQVHAHAPVL
jgi:hypothetical protein